MTHMTTLQKLCNTFITRSRNLGYRGKKRDNALMDFMGGAAAALYEVNHPDADHVNTVTGMLFSVRGFAEAEKIANG